MENLQIIEKNTAIDKFKSPMELTRYVLKHYFRNYPDEPLDTFIEKLRALPYVERVTKAATLQYPDVLIILSRDLDPSVREAVRENEFWQIIGRHYDMVEFSLQEKLHLIETADLTMLLALLVFEKDLKVLATVLKHPLISFQQMLEIEKVLSERGFGLEDQKLLAVTRKILEIKRQRFYHIADIHKAKAAADKNGVLFLLKNVLHEDEVIRHSALNALQGLPFKLLVEYLSDVPGLMTDLSSMTDLTDIFIVLYEQFVPGTEISDAKPLGREKLRKIAMSEQQWKEFIYNALKFVMNQAASDLNDFNNIMVVIKGHLSGIPQLERDVRAILSLEDIFTLIEDEHYPRNLSKKIVKELEGHPDPFVKKRIQQFYMMESERLRKKLKEMELSINAYFDIIFDSLGYPQIYGIRQRLKLLDQSFKLFENFFSGLGREYFESRKGFLKMYYLLIKDYQRQLESIYTDISGKRLEEIKELYDVLQLIYDVKTSFIESEIGSDADGEDKSGRKTIKQADVIWKSALSQYLGRLKELDELIRKKWLHYIAETGEKKDREYFLPQMRHAIQKMETAHKKEVSCNLPITCKVCQKRSCASIRFLKQVEFFSSELIDYMKGEKEEF